jgi:hypothetical protein
MRLRFFFCYFLLSLRFWRSFSLLWFLFCNRLLS